VKEVRSDNFQGGFGVSDHAGGSDNSEVGFGGIGGALDQAQNGESGGGVKGRGRRRKQGERQRMVKGRAQGRVSQKGDGGDGGVEGTLVACSLGAVAEAAEVWRRWQGKVKF